MVDLKEFGYESAPAVRYIGGPFAMRRPDGKIVWEKDFAFEIDDLLGQ